MEMDLKIDFDNPVFSDEQVLKISTNDLDDFYSQSSDADKTNLFFMLLASLNHYEKHNDTLRAAHLSFLTAYYLFSPLTPPGSYSLALHYIQKAIALHDCPEYQKCLEIMLGGN